MYYRAILKVQFRGTVGTSYPARNRPESVRHQVTAAGWRHCATKSADLRSGQQSGSHIVRSGAGNCILCGYPAWARAAAARLRLADDHIEIYRLARGTAGPADVEGAVG